MPDLLHFSDSGWGGVGATILLDNGDPCLLSIAQVSVRVKRSRSGFFGPNLYNESDLYKAARTGAALRVLFPVVTFPRTTRHPVLLGFANAIWNCRTAGDVAVILNEASGRVTAEQLDEFFTHDPHTPFPMV